MAKSSRIDSPRGSARPLWYSVNRLTVVGFEEYPHPPAAQQAQNFITFKSLTDRFV
jgi:hypothetical protein